MTEPADRQPEPAYCTFKEQRGKVKYRCIRESHDDSRHTLKREDEITDPLRAYFAATAVTDLEDRDTVELVPTDPPSATDVTVAKVVHQLAGLAERKHFADQYAHEIDQGIALAEDIAAAATFWADYRLADAEALRRIKTRVDALLLQRGIVEDGGA